MYAKPNCNIKILFLLLSDILSSKIPHVISPKLQRGNPKTSKDEDERGSSSPIGISESVACNYHTLISHTFCFSTSWIPFIFLYYIRTFFAAEGYIRGRSYNIKLDDQVLLRFSPKKSDSNYYFSDMVNSQESIVNLYFVPISKYLCDTLFTDRWNPYFFS